MNDILIRTDLAAALFEMEQSAETYPQTPVSTWSWAARDIEQRWWDLAARVKELTPHVKEAWITVAEADRYYWAMPRLQPLVIAQLAKLGSTNQLLKVVKSRRIRCEKCGGQYTLSNRAQWHDHLILHRCYAAQQFSNRYGKVEA